MLYPKNVPNIERALRIGFGVVLIGLAIALITSGQSVIGVGAALGTAAFVIVTGFVGWCPACALIGRKIKQNQPKS